MKILIVEDKQESRYLLEVLLKSKGYEVISAANGEKALEIIENQDIDLIISDILMPEMDGFKFCQHIKRDESRKNIPFIFYTATYVDKKDEEFAMGLGADMFLKKPMEPQAFLEKVETITSKIKEGEYNPQQLKLKREGDIYNLYNERLINKLEDKIDQLEAEIEKRKKIERELHKTIDEKKILLRELYHRTKNNLQVISSMMRLRSHSLQNELVTNLFQDLENKILSMALVHQKLYESKSLSQIYLKKYFESIINLLKQSLITDEQRIDIQIEGSEVQVLLDTAMPLGIILNELITNSVKYAFPDEQKGEIMVNLQLDEKRKIILEFYDNGIGLPAKFDLEKDGNIGLHTVKDLVNYQLQGEISFKNRDGFFCEIIIKEEQYEPRI